MRQRFRFTLAAAGHWPDADSGGRNLPPFNWVRIDNRGTGSVVVSPAPVGLNALADNLDYSVLVPAGQVRVFNVGPPRHNVDPDPVHPDPEMGASTDTWWHELHLYSVAGTTVEVDIADYPLVDLVQGVAGQSVPLGGVTVVDDPASSTHIARVFQPLDATGAVQALGVNAFGLIFNGTTRDQARSASAANLIAESGLGAALVAPPGLWTVVSAPAVNTQASASQAAGAAGVRHVLVDASAGLVGDATGNADTALFNLRDGATGAGTVKKAGRLSMIAGAANGAPPIDWGTLNFPGTAATAATMESNAAPAAHSFVVATLAGYDAS